MSLADAIIEEQPLSLFLGFLTLLKVFLRSSDVKENDTKKVFGVKGISLHENYILYGEFPNEKIREVVANCLLKELRSRAKY